MRGPGREVLVGACLYFQEMVDYREFDDWRLAARYRSPEPPRVALGQDPALRKRLTLEELEEVRTQVRGELLRRGYTLAEIGLIGSGDEMVLWKHQGR